MFSEKAPAGNYLSGIREPVKWSYNLLIAIKDYKS
jgi:hypothetical protein